MSIINNFKVKFIYKRCRFFYFYSRKSQLLTFVNIFISSNIPTIPTYEVHSYVNLGLASIYSDWLDTAQLLTQKLLQQGYVVPSVKSLEFLHSSSRNG